MSELISRETVINKLKRAYWDKKIQSAKDDPCVVDALIDWAIRQVKDVPPSNLWHTGTPTEDGDYFVAYHWGLDNKIMHDMASRILYGATTFENGNWKIDYPYLVVAWRKIEPYRG